MKKFITCFMALVAAICIYGQDLKTVNVSLLNNTYINSSNPDIDVRRPHRNGMRVGKNGLVLKEDTKTTATTYIYFTADQSPLLSLLAKGKGKIEVTIGGKKKVVKINSNDYASYKLGNYTTSVDGYMRINYRLVESKDEINVKYVTVVNKEEPIALSEDFNTHFGLRGPSCHLGYDVKEYGDEFEWSTLSITVPEEWDKVGSYYMALGFSCGYFGFQNNSEDKRMVLFSVWNSVDSDNPEDVKEDHRTKVMAKGEGVTAQDFGHEGSGKQSFINIDWKPGTTYTFLLHAEKVDATHTDFSGWFYDTPNDKWYYLSTLRRPDTDFLIKGHHSFLENFVPGMGDKTRKAYYHNVWVKPVGQDWKPVSRARLTNDKTGNEGIRLDFNGGTEGDRFYLTNGGYFDRARKINRFLKLEQGPTETPKMDLTKFTHP